MSRPAVKWARFAVAILFSLFCSSILFAPSVHQGWFGVSGAEAGQASSPDLVVSSISNPPTSAIAGTSFSVTDTTENSGNATANPSTTRYRLSTDATITSSDSLLTGTRSVPTLNKNTSSSGSVTVTIPAGQTPGTYYLGACADDLSVIAESNETNNCRASTTTIVVSAPASISTLSPSSGPIGLPITINGSDFGITQGSSTVRFNGTLATPTNWSATAITVPVPSGATTGPVVVTVGGVASNGVTFTLTYSPRVNTGGSNYTDGTGNYWAADRAYGSGPWGYVGGSTYSTSGAIANTDDDPLYQSERFGTMGYKFDVPNGKYDITLLFAEIYFGNPGQRTFRVSIEGVVVLDNYDIVAEVGSYFATSKTFYGIDVADGQLNIDFTNIITNAKISAISISPAHPTKLIITSVNSGNTPTAGVGFPVIVQAQNPNGVPTNVTTATNVSLSVQSGGGTLTGGTTTGTISVGANQLALNGVTYSKNDFGVVLKASATSGEIVSPGYSTPFNVVAGNPTSLAFTFQPTNSTTSGAITGPPTVAARDNAGNTIPTWNSPITLALANNPGGATLSGTAVQNPTLGVAAFADLHLNQAATGYTLTASSPGLTSATSSSFNVVAAGSVGGTVSKSTGGTIAGATLEALQSGVVKGTAGTNASGAYTITGLVPGNYDVRASAGAFAPQTQAGLTVSGGSTTTVNFSLSAATATAGIVYIYDELQRLKAVIDPVGEAATYSYDAVGNLLSITRNNASQTSVIDFNPNSGPIGSAVTIYGTGYSATPSQNTVTFNGVAATVISSTLTQIATTVPVGATSGQIAVTTPAGSATSSTSFVVSGPLPSITSFAPNIGTAGTAVTISGANFSATPANNDVRFNRLVAAAVSSSTPTSIQTTVPTGAQSGPITAATANGIGKSTQDFFITPSGLNTTDVDSTGRITIGGAPLVMSVNTANKVALAIFDGVVGQGISAQVSNSTFPDAGGSTTSATLTILRPDGLQLGPVLSWHLANGTPGENFFDVQRLPMTGTYTVIVDPTGTNTGQATITLYNVPAEPQGPITPGGAAVTVVTPIPGQNGRLTFTGAPNQRVNVVLSNSTYPDLGSGTTSATLKILKPDGSVLASLGWHSANDFLEAVVLPVAGTYTLLIDPYWTHTGQVTVSVPEQNLGTITPGGAAVPVNITTLGEVARLTFTANAGDMISGTFTAGTLTCCGYNGNVNISILKPDGTLVSNATFGGYWGDGFMDTVTLPVTGTYTVLIDPSGTATGTGTVQLYPVTDVTGPITPGGAAVSVSLTTPGQNARLTFTANAGDMISGTFTAGTLTCCGYNGNVNITVLKPDGTQVTNASFGGYWGDGSLTTTTLPDLGTYTVLVDPGNTTIGNGTVQLSVVP